MISECAFIINLVTYSVFEKEATVCANVLVVKSSLCISAGATSVDGNFEEYTFAIAIGRQIYAIAVGVVTLAEYQSVKWPVKFNVHCWIETILELVIGTMITICNQSICGYYITLHGSLMAFDIQMNYFWRLWSR